MTTARTLGLGLGLIVLVGVGAATFSRAQQTAARPAPSAPRRSELQERVISLRAEVDLLQMDYDLAKPRLMEALSDEGKVKTGNPLHPVFDMQDAAQMILQELKKGAKKGESLLDTKEVTDLLSEVRKKVNEQTAKQLKDLLEEGKEEAFASRLAELECSEDAGLNESRKKAERERQRFLQKARNLHAKQLDLAEAEKQYQSEAR
jgi:hypothetical protein